MSRWILTGFEKAGSYKVGNLFGGVMSSIMFEAMMNFTDRKTNEAIEKILQRCVREAKKLSLPGRSMTLHDSITYIMVPEQRWGSFGSDVEYARYVNDGTRYMAGRHFLEGALDAVKIERLGG